MKMRTKWALPTVIVVCLALLVGVVYLLNTVFPKAKPIRMPKVEDVISMSVSADSTRKTIPMSEEYWDRTVKHITKAAPTRQQSLNDHPGTKPYYGIVLQTKGIQYCCFVYEKDGQVYIELPYDGIYKADSELYDIVLACYQED